MGTVGAVVWVKGSESKEHQMRADEGGQGRAEDMRGRCSVRRASWCAAARHAGMQALFGLGHTKVFPRP